MPKLGPNLHYDVLGHAVILMDHVHHKGHEGKYFTAVHEAAGIALDEDQLYLVKPAEVLHYSHVVTSDTASIVRFYEGPTVTDDGTGLTPRTTNRYLAKDDPANIFCVGPTVSANGTLLSSNRMGGTSPGRNRSYGTSAMGIIEWNLNPEYTYLLRLTANDTTVDFSTMLIYYRP